MQPTLPGINLSWTLPAARMVWSDELGEGRNTFCLFLRRFTLDSVPTFAEFHLFADSLYRLRVNGRVIGFGPARFLPSHPEFDSYDLACWLRPGENTILVEVNSRGAPCYQAVVSRGGFSAWGTVHLDHGTVLNFTTLGAWRCCPSRAWEQNAEPFSFAQGPIEILNQSLLPHGYPAFLNGTREHEWQDPAEAAAPEHWARLSPRSIPMPSLNSLEPRRIVLAGALAGGLVRYGFNAGNSLTQVRQPFFTHIYSDEAREIDLGIFWGPVFVNGEKLHHASCDRRGNRDNSRATLRAGWNFIYGLPELIKPCWTWLMDHPDLPGLVLRALPDHDCEFTFALGPVRDQPLEGLLLSIPSSREELADGADAWRLIPINPKSCSPARELAWDIIDEVWQRNALPSKEIELLDEGNGATVVLDMGEEYLGHVFIEFESEKGAILDLGYDELLKKDGSLAYYRRNPHVNSADRFICAPGSCRVDTFHERGGRYIQLTFRGSGGQIRIKQVGLLQTTAQHQVAGNFECADSLFNWTWQVGQRTLEAGMADGWIDSPWRERGMYIGDVLVEAPASRKFITDWRIEPWAIRLFARSQLPNGQIPDVVPSDRDTPLFDYSLLWVQILRNYWAVTGDVELVREVWPAVERIFSSSTWKPDEEGLWSTQGPGHIFVGWGCHPDERLGVNGVLNAFRIRALECAAELAGAVGLIAEKERHDLQAHATRAAFRRAFWNKKKKRFAAGIVDGNLSECPSLHVNTLALAYGLSDASQEAGVLAYLGDELQQNICHFDGHLDLYFLSYLWVGLYRVGRAGWAESLIREHYAIMREHDAWTFWETLKRGSMGHDSFCHGWAASPLIVFSERILGVRELVPGIPSQILVAPECESLEWADGIVPHPFGLIHVAWRVEGTSLLLSLDLPPGVRAQIRPAGRLAELNLVRLPALPPSSGAVAEVLEPGLSTVA